MFENIREVTGTGIKRGWFTMNKPASCLLYSNLQLISKENSRQNRPLAISGIL